MTNVHELDRRLKVVERKVGDPEITTEGCLSQFVVAVVVLVGTFWLSFIMAPRMINSAHEDPRSGDACAADAGRPCVFVATDKDCSWIPLTPCYEWVPLPEGAAE